MTRKAFLKGRRENAGSITLAPTSCIKLRHGDPSSLGAARYQRQANKIIACQSGRSSTLIEMGLVELRDELPLLTTEGERALDWN
jgi:hypothetical protein